MKIKGLILPAVVVGGLLWYNSTHNLISRLRVRFDKLGKFDLFKTQGELFSRVWFDIKLNIENVTNGAASVSHFDFDILYKDKPVARVARGDAFQVGPNGVTPLTVSVGVSPLALYASIRDAATAIAFKQGVNLRLKGKLYSSLGTVNVDETIKVV